MVPLVLLPGFVRAFQERLELALVEVQVHELMLDDKVVVVGIKQHCRHRTVWRLSLCQVVNRHFVSLFAKIISAGLRGVRWCGWTRRTPARIRPDSGPGPAGLATGPPPSRRAPQAGHPACPRPDRAISTVPITFTSLPPAPIVVSGARCVTCGVVRNHWLSAFRLPLNVGHATLTRTASTLFLFDAAQSEVEAAIGSVPNMCWSQVLLILLKFTDAIRADVRFGTLATLERTPNPVRWNRVLRSFHCDRPGGPGTPFTPALRREGRSALPAS